jgi:alpha-beta hydrolase superfamily lysophospholipase
MTASPSFPKIPADWSQTVLKIQGEHLSLRFFYDTSLHPFFTIESSVQNRKIRVLYVVHGQGEQSGRYEHFAHYLKGIVDVIACIDLPGHGLSQGRRGHIEKFSEYHEAVHAGFEFVKDLFKNAQAPTEFHWFGHSLGGLISLGHLFKHPEYSLKSVCISAPLLQIAVPVPPLKKFFGELVEPLLGKLSLSNELDGSLVSHEPSVAKAYDENPLNHGFVTPRFFVQLSQEMNRVNAITDEFPFSLMMVVPLEDRIVSWQRNLNFFKTLKVAKDRKKYLCSLPNYYHEAFNDFGKERAFNALSDWIEAKL